MRREWLDMLLKECRVVGDRSRSKCADKRRDLRRSWLPLISRVCLEEALYAERATDQSNMHITTLMSSRSVLVDPLNFLPQTSNLKSS